jgi:hypothetical protein
MHRVISTSVVVVVLIIVVMLTNIIRLWRSAQSCRRTKKNRYEFVGFSDLSGQILTTLLTNFRTRRRLYIYTYHVGAGSGKIKIHPLEGHVQCPADVGGVQGTFESFRLAKRDEL